MVPAGRYKGFIDLMVFLMLVSTVRADCLAPHSFTYTATGTNDVTNLDVRDVSFFEGDLSNLNCSNVLGIYSSGRLNIDTSAGKEAITCWVHDSRTNITHGSDATSPDEVKDLEDSDFTQVNKFYTLTLRYEENNSLWSYPANPVQEFKVLCDEYSTATVPFHDFNRTFFLSTMERPVLEARVGETFIRRRTLLSDTLTLDYFIPAGFNSTVSINFELKDQTNTWTDSVLEISILADDVNTVVDSREWMDDLTISNVHLIQDAEYHVLLREGSNSQDKGRYTFPINATRWVHVTEGTYTIPSRKYPGLDWNIWGNFSTSRVYGSYSVPAGTCDVANFTVFNCTSTGFDCTNVLYSTTSSSDSATFSYEVPVLNWTYLVNLQVEYSSYDFEREKFVELENASARALGAFPGGRVFGFTWATVINFIVFIIIIGTMVGAHQLNLSYGALFGSLELMFFNYFEMITPELPQLLVVSIFIMAVLERIYASRRGVG